ncbi:hypothetical protein [Vibrio phage vB_VhaP_PG11]|nr:hypothetical protein [Vibrio phage vB_VhaP_PG11]
MSRLTTLLKRNQTWNNPDTKPKRHSVKLRYLTGSDPNKRANLARHFWNHRDYTRSKRLAYALLNTRGHTCLD